MPFNKDNKPAGGYNRISIGLASPEEILAQSSGEVLKPETINYRTYKPAIAENTSGSVTRVSSATAAAWR